MVSTKVAVRVVLVPAVVLVASCAKAPPPRCEGEPAPSEQVQQDARVRITTLASPADPTAGGRLHGGASTGARPMNAVLLLDSSGSMFAGYDRPAVPGCAQCKASASKRNGQPFYFAVPEFRRMLARLIDELAPQGASIKMRALLFNKDVWTFEQKKPKKLAGTTVTFPWDLSTMSAAAIDQALAELPDDPFATGASANETHLKPAVERAVELLLHSGDEGLVWLVTDNIADTSGGNVSADDARRNLEFYQYLKSEPRLQLVYAYPLHDTEKCTVLCGGSLFVYALYVSQRERAGLDEVNRLSGNHFLSGEPGAATSGAKDGVLWNSGLQAVAGEHAGAAAGTLRGVPLRLKPMDLGAVSVNFLRGKSGKPEPLKCKQSSEFGQAVPCLATLVVKNNLRHERVDSAALTFTSDLLLPHKQGEAKRLRWAGGVCSGKVTARPTSGTGGVDDKGRFPVGPIDPGQEQKLQVLLLVPPVVVAPTSVGDIADVAMTDALYLDGTLHARIEDVKTSLIVPADQRERVYGAANLPEIFTSRNESEVQARFPAIVVVNNDGKLQALLLIGALLLALLLIGFLVFRFSPAYCTVYVDGVEVDRLRVPRIASRAVEQKGVRLGSVRRGVGLPTFVPAKGSQAKRQGAAWIVVPPGGGALEKRVELKHGWRTKGGKAEAAPGAF